MSTEPRKPPPRIHKALKRFADEQAEEGPSKKSKTVVSGSATKPKMTANEKPTKKAIQPSTSKAPHVAPSQKRAATVEPVEDLADRPRSKPPLDPTRVLELADRSDDETRKNDDDQSVVEILEEPEESAEAELSPYHGTSIQWLFTDLFNLRALIEGLPLTNICFLQANSTY